MDGCMYCTTIQRTGTDSDCHVRHASDEKNHSESSCPRCATNTTTAADSDDENRSAMSRPFVPIRRLSPFPTRAFLSPLLLLLTL